MAMKILEVETSKQKQLNIIIMLINILFKNYCFHQTFPNNNNNNNYNNKKNNNKNNDIF